MRDIFTTTWHGCYRNGWQGICVPEAFEHPAKYACGLISRIYAHLLTRGYVQAGDTVLDPFGGVASGAFHAMLNGISWSGVELEPRFVALGQQNLTYWQQRYGLTDAVLLQGDSRRLREILGTYKVNAVVASPPFCSSTQVSTHPADMTAGKAVWANGTDSAARVKQDYHQAITPGQLGAFPVGSVDCVLSSPPYGGNEKADYSLSDDGKTRRRDVGRGYRQGHGCFRGSETYGTTEGQLGTMRVQDVSAVISSPPYAQQVHGGNGIDDSKRHDQRKTNGIHSQARAEGYGDSPGNLGNMNGGQTFWAAARDVVQEAVSLLVPGGVAVWVVKPFVRDKALVDFPGDWQRLCEHCGLTLVERIEASLIEYHGIQGNLFEGPETRQQTARKSFFRRLAEQHGSPSIDAEIVLILRKGRGTP